MKWSDEPQRRQRRSTFRRWYSSGPTFLALRPDGVTAATRDVGSQSIWSGCGFGVGLFKYSGWLVRLRFRFSMWSATCRIILTCSLNVDELTSVTVACCSLNVIALWRELIFIAVVHVRPALLSSISLWNSANRSSNVWFPCCSRCSWSRAFRYRATSPNCCFICSKNRSSVNSKGSSLYSWVQGLIRQAAFPLNFPTANHTFASGLGNFAVSKLNLARSTVSNWGYSAGSSPSNDYTLIFSVFIYLNCSSRGLVASYASYYCSWVMRCWTILIRSSYVGCPSLRGSAVSMVNILIFIFRLLSFSFLILLSL